MRVGINGLFWPQENTGSGQYTRQLWQKLPALNQTEPADEQVSYTLLGYRPAVPLDEIPASQKLLANVPAAVQRGGDNAVKLWWEQAGLPGLVSAEKKAGRAFDVIHWPYFAAALKQPPAPCATIVTIHDLIPLVLPDYAPSLPLKVYFKLVSRAAQQATLVLADSEHSRQDILRLLKLPEDKVETVYLGTDPVYRPAQLSAEQRQTLFQKYGLQGHERVIFYIGGFDRRKNMPMLIEAFGRALPRLKELEQAEGPEDARPWTLAIAGKAHSTNSEMYPDLREPARRALSPADSGRIHFLGRVDEEDKAPLYQSAEMFVFPSLYEGFGLDPLDALACGIPTICSNASSLPELMGDAAVLVSPGDTKAWTEALVELASNEAKRAALAEAGPVQAARFSWEKTAERTLQLYHAAECIMTRGKKR
ncbi:MAG TPA: glycosyltransferase family 1 protein [Chloroflexia bacterium]|nr:glycosyltransferase family 1 protein [Chloroflexia bacterium]